MSEEEVQAKEAAEKERWKRRRDNGGESSSSSSSSSSSEDEADEIREGVKGYSDKVLHPLPSVLVSAGAMLTIVNRAEPRVKARASSN
jgi:hypothetical protein